MEPMAHFTMPTVFNILDMFIIMTFLNWEVTTLNIIMQSNHIQNQIFSTSPSPELATLNISTVFNA